MPRTRPVKRVDARIADEPVIEPVRDERQSKDADDGELQIVPVTNGSPWRYSAYAGDKEVARIAYVGPGVDPGGPWCWAIVGPHACVKTYADAVAELRRRWAAR